MIRRRFVLLMFCIFIFPTTLFAAERNVTIESARSTEYIKDDGSQTADKTEIIRFSGAVMIVVTEGSSVSRIGADEIVYNKTRDTLEAHGHVTYDHTTGKSGSEKFTGDGLLFNIEKQEGVFLGGFVKQDSGKKNGDPFIIHAEVSGHDSSSTMAFKNGILTTCDAEEPHWSINASRIWLLPGNEIAILNGVFFIGPLPVFYIPFFYYPADEMIFHPVFGFRNREGYFVQTTTYLAGRKPLATKSATDTGTSFTDFLQSDTLKEQKHNGLFLENLKEDAKTTNSDYLKVMADAYSGLGAMFGIDGSFTPSSYIKSVSFSGMFGFSRTLYPQSTGIFYSTYDTNGEQHYNSSRLFGFAVPFRYRTDFSMRMDKAPFQLTMSLPLVSDQEFKVDFTDRSEDLNWFKMLTEQSTLAEGTTISDETSYSWNITGSYHPDVSFAGHWLKTFDITSLTGLLTFDSKPNSSLSGDDLLYAPGKTFFYPEIIRPSIQLSLGGSLLSSSSTSDVSVKTGSDATKNTGTKKVDTGGLYDPFTQKNAQDSAPQPKDTTAGTQKGDNTAERFIPSAGTGLVPSVTTGESAYDIIWALSPSFIHEARYDATDWNTPADINWNNFSSLYYQLATTAKVEGTYTYDKNYFTASSALNFTGTHQDHTKLSGSLYDTQTEKDVVKLSDYQANVYTISSTEGISLVPFNHDDLLKPMSVSWNFTGDLVRNVFDGTASAPDWKQEFFQWNKNHVDTHTATTVIGIAPGNYEQKITIISNLPPLLQSYTGAAAFAWKFGTLNMNTRLYEQDVSTSDSKWVWDPFKAALLWKLPYDVTLGQEYTYNIEDNEPTRLNFTGSKGDFSLYYTLTNTIPYVLKAGQGWVLDGSTNKFIPSEAGCAFSNTSDPLKLYSWKNRIFIQASLNSNLKFNLLRLTESSFDFKPSITFKFSDFLDVTFSSTSSNELIARYFQKWMNLPVTLPGETNPFIDLIKSFNFFNNKDRLSSGYKLKSLNLTLTHYLHDWTMNLSTTVEPVLKLEGTVYRYEFIPTVIFLVQWKPVSDIKTKVRSKEGVFSLNASDSSDAITTTD